MKYFILYTILILIIQNTTGLPVTKNEKDDKKDETNEHHDDGDVAVSINYSKKKKIFYLLYK